MDTRYFGLTPAQYFSVGVTVLGAWILWTRRNMPPMRGDWVPDEEAG